MKVIIWGDLKNKSDTKRFSFHPNEIKIFNISSILNSLLHPEMLIGMEMFVHLHSLFFYKTNFKF